MFHGLSNLLTLYLNENQIEKFVSFAFYSLPNIVSLSLKENKITDLDLEQFNQTSLGLD